MFKQIIKTSLVYLMTSLFLIIIFSQAVMAVDSDNIISSDNVSDPEEPLITPETDLSKVYKGGLNTKTEIIAVIDDKINTVESRINNSTLIRLNRIPENVRNKVLNLSVSTKNSLIDVKDAVKNRSDVREIKYIVQEKEKDGKARRLSLTHNQAVLFLKNYNRLYDRLQKSYTIVNDAITYIDIHNKNSDQYFGLDYFPEDVYNNEVLPIRTELETIKTDQLDVFYSALNLKMSDIEALNLDNPDTLSASELDDVRREFLNALVLDFPTHKENYNNNIKTEIVGTINSLLAIDEVEEINIPCEGQVTDEDGNTYGTVKIGGQCWMAENLKVGTMLASGSDEPNTSDTVIEKWCYKNDPNNCDEYGGLYSWDEAMQGSEVEGSQGVCMDGWHIPTDEEINILEKNVMQVMGGSGSCSISSTGDQCDPAGQGLKAVGEGNGTDEVGFSGKLAGYRNTNGSYYPLGAYLHLWSSTPSSSTSAFRRSLHASYSTVNRGFRYRGYGFSVRCLKD